MRRFTCLGMVGLAGFLILHTSMAFEPVANAVPNEEQRPQADLVLDARLKLIEQGLGRSAPPVQPQEAVILLATLKGRIETLLAIGNSHPAFAKNNPATLDDFEKLFWSMHVFSNQLTSASRFFDYAQELKATARKYKPKANDTTDTTILQADWARLKTDMIDLRERLTQRDREMRISRLMLADKVLTGSKDLSERLLSALALDMDGDSLPQALAKDATVPTSQTQKVIETIQHARTVAGRELLQKSRLLFTGLHWWLRGRYGVGTYGGGLMKDSAALNSPDVMFGLMMPVNLPIPTAPNAKDPVPLVDRRHHYLWQFETRQLVSAGSQTSTSTKEFVPISVNVTTTSYFY